MNIRMLGQETYMRQTRPQEMVEHRDAQGNLISREVAAPAEVTIVDARAPVAAGLPIVPIILAVGAAYLLAKG